MISLEPGAVHVWTANLDEPAPPAEWLDPEESARARRFYFERDRRHFAAARSILRGLLGRYLDTSAGGIRFGYGGRGKPSVVSPGTDVRFNLSHSNRRALFVFARARALGVDLEAGARLKDDWPALARRVFSAREQAELAALPPGQRRAAFLNGWTRKEAYLKATGLGIVDGLQTIEVTLGPARPCALLAGPAGTAWTLHDLRTDEDFAAALAVEGTEPIRLERFAWAWTDHPPK